MWICWNIFTLILIPDHQTDKLLPYSTPSRSGKSMVPPPKRLLLNSALSSYPWMLSWCQPAKSISQCPLQRSLGIENILDALESKWCVRRQETRRPDLKKEDCEVWHMYDEDQKIASSTASRCSRCATTGLAYARGEGGKVWKKCRHQVYAQASSRRSKKGEKKTNEISIIRPHSRQIESKT